MIPSCVRQLRPIGGECEILAALQAVGRLTTYSPTERKANRNHSKPDTGRKWPARTSNREQKSQEHATIH